MDITRVHQAISDAVNAAALQPGALQVTATPFMPLHPTVPHFYPFSWRINYDRTFGGAEGTPSGMNELLTTWHLCLSLSADEAGHEEATTIAGSGEETIRDVILSTRGGPGEYALSGAAEDVRLVSASGPNLVNISETTQLLVIEFPIQAIGR